MFTVTTGWARSPPSPCDVSTFAQSLFADQSGLDPVEAVLQIAVLTEVNHKFDALGQSNVEAHRPMERTRLYTDAAEAPLPVTSLPPTLSTSPPAPEPPALPELLDLSVASPG